MKKNKSQKGNWKENRDERLEAATTQMTLSGFCYETRRWIPNDSHRDSNEWRTITYLYNMVSWEPHMKTLWKKHRTLQKN